ncbi:hypothetical protein G7054_g8361 [Neopestalotiopsis clavispora]|nr:hypothetical protein G7054_g8361 [Neopestalotiopsis clavispora]
MAALPPDCDVDFEAEMRGYDFTALDPQHLYHQTGVQQPVPPPPFPSPHLLVLPAHNRFGHPADDSPQHAGTVPGSATQAPLRSGLPAHYQREPAGVEPHQSLPTPSTICHHQTTDTSSRDGTHGDGALKRKGSQRRHYAVEKRYRSTLNKTYAILARTVSSDAVQRICRTESPDWAMHLDRPPSFSSGDDTAAATAVAPTAGTRVNPQRKTATLSATIETIGVLTRCCLREARKLEQLKKNVQEVRNRMQQVLEECPPTLPAAQSPALPPS